jgi:hypothetical protein
MKKHLLLGGAAIALAFATYAAYVPATSAG